MVLITNSSTILPQVPYRRHPRSNIAKLTLMISSYFEWNSHHDGCTPHLRKVHMEPWPLAQ